MKKILVVGSMNVDLVVEADKKPKVGETIFGNNFQTFQGGKGANQCVAAAKLDADCQMLGSVGNDSFGVEVLENLEKNNINIKHINKVSNQSTGIAIIEVVQNDNSIIVIPGANSKTDIKYIEKYKSQLLESDIVILQLEIPLETVEWIVGFLYKNDKKVILNPAPAIKLSKEILDKITYITPNEHECGIVFGSDKTAEDHMREYPNKLIITEGEKGVKYFDGKDILRIPSMRVDVVDTTGAGDTFNGAFAIFALEYSLEEALRRACIAGALSVTKLGAQQGMPTLEEVNMFI